MALKGSTELLEQAQAISRSSSNIQNLYSEVDDKAILADGEEGREGPQGRRRALGRQKARFSLKPMPSHSSANSSIDQFFEPQEYFLATEQLQKADEELKKLKGGPVTDPLLHNQSTAVRRHRPGILGRTASYKHHLSVNADTTETLRVSQEVIPDRIPSPAKTSIDLEPGIIAKEQSVEDLLEKLFSSFKDMDGGDGVALLQERLQIKSTEFGKINLTELGSTQKNNLRALRNTMAKKRLDSSQLPQQISPTPTRSPLGVIANLKRHISLKDSLDDPYAMPLGDDTPHSEGPSLSMGRDKQSLSSSEDIDDDVSSGLIVNDAFSPVIINGRSSNMDKLQLLLHDADRSIGNKMTSEKDFAKHSPRLLENRTEHNSSLLGDYEDNIPTELDDALEKEGNDMQLDASVSSQLDAAVKDLTSDYTNQNDTETWANPSNRKFDRNTSSSGIDAFTGSCGHEATFQVEVNVMLEGEMVADPEVPKDSLADPSSRNTDQNDSRSRINVGVRSFGHDVSSQHEVNVTVQGDSASEVEVFKGNLSPPRAVLPVDGHSENLCLLPEENNEMQEFQEASGVSPGIGRKRKAPPGGQNKRKPSSKGRSISRRRSLADAGMKWESGLRRSTRIKIRPLQYWCGERFLYGRIHDSLATVIGLKYASPEKDGKSPVLKVKSYVPQKYADLVSQAAL